jgi:hypothetical protein
MMNEKEVGALVKKLNWGDSVDKECANILQSILDIRPESPEAVEAKSGTTAKSISTARPDEKAVVLRFIELFPNDIHPSVIESLKTRLAQD